jgi:hypothetical protein
LPSEGPHTPPEGSKTKNPPEGRKMSFHEALEKLATQIHHMGGNLEEIRPLDNKTILVRINGREEVFEIKKTIVKGYVKTLLVGKR